MRRPAPPVTGWLEERTRKLIVDACTYGDALACFEAAQNWRESDDRIMEMERSERAQLLAAGCALGLGKACREWSVYDDAVDELSLLVRACELRDADGCFFAGQKFDERDDRANADRYYAIGCELGRERSCHPR